MNTDQNKIPEDELLKEAASKYVEQLGEELLFEMSFAEDMPLMFADQSRLAKKIKIKQRNARIKKITVAMVPVAACLIFMIIYFSGPVNMEGPANMGPASMERAADMESLDLAESSQNEIVMEDSASLDDSASLPDMAEEEAPREIEPESSMAFENPLVVSEEAAVEFLSARLPEGFTLTEIDYDNGQRICHIEGNNNTIVLVMEEWEDINHARPMTRIYVSDVPMDVLVMNNYSLLTFKKGDLRFTLTNPYDFRDIIFIGGLLL